jgi:hypothetical protein
VKTAAAGKQTRPDHHAAHLGGAVTVNKSTTAESLELTHVGGGVTQGICFNKQQLLSAIM